MLKLWNALRTSTIDWGNWFAEKAKTPHARAWLGTYSFFEALLLPFPTDVFLALLVYVDRARAAWLVILTTLTSLLGAATGYFFAYFFYSVLLLPLVEHLGMAGQVAQISETLGHYAFVAVFLGALTPIPYTPVVFAAGLLHADFFVFLVASLFGRGIRYSLVTIITLFFGTAVLPRLGRVATITTVVLCVCAALVFLVLRSVS